jgi:hypothetical protein
VTAPQGRGETATQGRGDGAIYMAEEPEVPHVCVTRASTWWELGILSTYCEGCAKVFSF